MAKISRRYNLIVAVATAFNRFFDLPRIVMNVGMRSAEE